MKYLTKTLPFALLFFFLSFSATKAATFKDLVDNIVDNLAVSVVRLVFALAFIFFFWGVVQYTVMPGAESKDKGRGYMVWGLIALTVMFSVYGIIKMIQNTLFN